MKHVHAKSGLTFECGDYVDSANGKTYDMTIITYWPDAESGAAEPVTLVDYYFGGYDARITDYYIDEWLWRQPWYHHNVTTYTLKLE